MGENLIKENLGVLSDKKKSFVSFVLKLFVSFVVKLFFPLLAAISLGSYLLASHRLLRIGFPLDDAWIHQAYARNLVEYGQWAFQPGQPSAGSTAPLWSGLLAVGYALGIDFYFWTFLLGWGLLAALAFAGRWVFRLLLPEKPNWAWFAGAILALEWHLAWAAGSGMETPLAALLALVVAGCLLALAARPGLAGLPGTGEQVRAALPWLGTGALVGLGVWVRPDSLTLLGPAGLAVLVVGKNWRCRLIALGGFALGFILVFAPYLLFNHSLSGSFWPNTFYAKQAEYAALRQLPLLRRLLEQALAPLVGAGALLLPGVLMLAWRSLRSRSWMALILLAWIAAFMGLYALRLPVTYQHGRYLIPVMPLLFLLGLAGLAAWVDFSARSLLRRVLSRVWIFSLLAVLFSFWIVGARTYARDVALIETEMVETTQWIIENTPPQALVAAHDIGALGYFGQRQILDLAGLVSPEVIPFIRDEAQLAAFLDERGADYLVAFPILYPQLVERSQLLFQAGGWVAKELGAESMAVYRWR
jgi:hypothetical protein